MFGNGWKCLNLSCQVFEYRQRFVLNWDLFLSTTFAAIISFSPSSADNWKISFFQLPEMTVIKFLPKATKFFFPCAMIPPPIAVTPSSASGAQSQTYKETVQFCSLIKVIIWFGLWFPYRACFRVYLCNTQSYAPACSKLGFDLFNSSLAHHSATAWGPCLMNFMQS